jgi:hypothetical protein
MAIQHAPKVFEAESKRPFIIWIEMVSHGSFLLTFVPNWI